MGVPWQIPKLDWPTMQQTWQQMARVVNKLSNPNIPSSVGTSFNGTAGTNINAYQVVTAHSDGKIYVADIGTLADADRVIGVAVTSASSGTSVTIQQLGVATNGGWSFTPGAVVWLGATGSLLQVPGSGTFQQSMGVALTATQLEIQLGVPIIL